MSIRGEIDAWMARSPEERLLEEIRRANAERDRTLVVLDDDPTGTQTVHDVPVITAWSADRLRGLLEEERPLFYVLTNSRSLNAENAVERVRTIARRLERASAETGRDVSIILRSDSTLRGHHPEEMDAVIELAGREPDVRVLHPAFMEGERFTYGGVHYARSDGEYIPCGETEYAEDPAFGYTSSSLADWIAEKEDGRVRAEEVHALGIETLREEDVDLIAERIAAIDGGDYLIADALSYPDIDTFSLALLKSGRSFVARTAASFVASIGGIDQRPLLTPEELRYERGQGGLVIVGSYVEKSTRQMNRLIEGSDVGSRELDVRELLEVGDRAAYLKDWAGRVKADLDADRDLVLYTSREVVTGNDGSEALDIGREISSFISDLVAALSVTPSFLIAKGGVTSSDVGTEGLGVSRARVMGQILPGVPVWELGADSKYPGLPYVIFPGNVGDENALLKAYQRIHGVSP